MGQLSGGALVCKRSFHAWGKSYNPGDVVDPSGWPEETLPNRLNGGDVAWEPVAPEADTVPAHVLDGVDLTAMTKAQLVAFGVDQLGLDTLDVNSTKHDLITAIQVAADA